MTSVILVVFCIQLALNLISSAGAQTVNNIAWWFFAKLPIEQARKAEETVKLRNEVVRLQREMIGVSAQDNFAKWARLRREHDKAKDSYEKEAKEHQSYRASFDSIVSKLRWISTQGVNFALNSWYAKAPMFWLPQGWVPYHAEWLLSFPRAPLGSISVNVWAIACGSVIGLLSEFIIALWSLRAGESRSSTANGRKPKTEQPVPAGGEGKKEL